MFQKLLPAFLLSFAFAGCAPSGPPLGTVSGTVTVDGKPAPGVDVMFSPVGEGRGSTGSTDASGQYKLSFDTASMGALIGKHEVAIRNAAPTDMNDPDAPMVPSGVVTPAYSELRKNVEVTAGDNTIDLAFP